MKSITKEEEKVWLEKFHVKLKIRMRELEINQKELAKRAGLSKSTLCYMMNGPYAPKVIHIIKVAKALLMKPSDLIDFA